MLNIKDARITCVNYGPFDNGYLLIGLSNGILLGISLHEMEIIMQEKLFNCAVNEINFEPTNLVFVSSKERDLIALNLVKKEMHYVYLEIAKRQFCTVTVPQTQLHSLNSSLNGVHDEEDPENTNRDSFLRICC